MAHVRFPIHHTFGPLATREQVALAAKLQLQPWRWKQGEATEVLRTALSQSFDGQAALFGSGRDALLATLRAINLTPGDEVIIQGYTCIVLPNAIHAANGVPVYCDIDPQTLNIDIMKFHQAITPRTRAVICQHTFGIPADTRKIRAICDKRGIMLIEDCAHIIPDAGSSDQLSLIESPSAVGEIGRFGDALIFSFGRDKAISGVAGGAVLTRHELLARPLQKMEKQAEELTKWNVMNLLGYPVRYRFAKAIWRTKLAKGYLHLLRVARMLPPVLTREEKKGRVHIALRRMPNACAALVLQQLTFLQQYNEHRRAITKIYRAAAEQGEWNVPSGVERAIALQKFPVYARNAEQLRAELKREQIYLHDGWSGAVVNPFSVDQETANYTKGSCPIAEDVAAHIVTLPTHPTTSAEQAKYLVHALRSYLG